MNPIKSFLSKNPSSIPQLLQFTHLLHDRTSKKMQEMQKTHETNKINYTQIKSRFEFLSKDELEKFELFKKAMEKGNQIEGKIKTLDMMDKKARKLSNLVEIINDAEAGSRNQIEMLEKFLENFFIDPNSILNFDREEFLAELSDSPETCEIATFINEISELLLKAKDESEKNLEKIKKELNDFTDKAREEIKDCKVQSEKLKTQLDDAAKDAKTYYSAQTNKRNLMRGCQRFFTDNPQFKIMGELSQKTSQLRK